MKETTFQVKTPADFMKVVELVLERASYINDGATLVSLTGEMGAGKTAFTQQLAAHLGVSEPVVSPTFGIMKGYELDSHPHYDQLVHIDAYRIEDDNEVGPLRFEELFMTPRTLVCLEWPDRIAHILPTKLVKVTIQITAGEEREVVVV